jgi:hypothetical protein
MESISTAKGMISMKIEWLDGRVEYRETPNRILLSGRQAQANAIANEFGSAFEYFVTNMAFGSGGTVGGAPRYVDDTRTGLFSLLTTKPVISSIDPSIPTQVTFTSVLTFDEVVGDVINEMALKMQSGDYYSMATFGDITKTSSMQLTFNWKISYV